MIDVKSSGRLTLLEHQQQSWNRKSKVPARAITPRRKIQAKDVETCITCNLSTDF